MRTHGNLLEAAKSTVLTLPQSGSPKSYSVVVSLELKEKEDTQRRDQATANRVLTRCVLSQGEQERDPHTRCVVAHLPNDCCLQVSLRAAFLTFQQS